VGAASSRGDGFVVERDAAEAGVEAGAGDGQDERFSRRGVLTGAMLGAAAIMLASCRGGDDDDEGEDD